MHPILLKPSYPDLINKEYIMKSILITTLNLLALAPCIHAKQ